MGLVDPYFLAIDVGTSRVAAAVSRVGADGRITSLPFALGRRGDTAPAVAFVVDDDVLLFGDAAERRGVSEPERLIREFKRSIGDDIPFVVGGRVIAAERLYAETAATVVAAVTEREGTVPAGIVLTHPVAWGAHRLGVVRDALVAVGLDEVEMMTEPEAAARHYEAERPLSEGGILAVYDLGGGTFDAVVLRRERDGFVMAGHPTGIADLGGADFDDQVLRHVIGAARIDPEHLSVDRDDTRLVLSQLRRECVEAKEALSYDSDATIPVLLGSGSPSVRLTRGEFESMIDGAVERTVDALDDVIASARIAPEDLEGILLIGGSSRIPLVTQRLSERFDRPLAIDADPKSSIALGAARTGLVRTTDRALGVSDDSPEEHVDTAADDATDTEDAAAAPVAPSVAAHGPGRMSRPHMVALAAGTVFFVAAVLFSTSEAAGSRLTATDESATSSSPLSFDLPTSEPEAAAASDTPADAVPPAAESVFQPATTLDEAAASTSDSSSSRPKTATRSPLSTSGARADTEASTPSLKNPRVLPDGTATLPLPTTPVTPTGTQASDANDNGPTGTTGSTGYQQQSTSTGTTGSQTNTAVTAPSPSPSSSPDPVPSPSPSTEPSPSPSTEPSTGPSPDPSPSADPEPEPSSSPTSEPEPSSDPEAPAE